MGKADVAPWEKKALPAFDAVVSPEVVEFCLCGVGREVLALGS